MLNKNIFIKYFSNPFPIIFIITIINGLAIYFINIVKYTNASAEEIQLKYVTNPNIPDSLFHSLILVTVTYFIYRLFIHLFCKGKKIKKNI